MKMPVSNSFGFQAQGLPQKLSQISEGILTGYWLCEFFLGDRDRPIEPFYIGLLQGQVVFSGQPVTWETLFKTLQRYVPRLRNEAARHAILAIRQKLYPGQQDAEVTGLLELFDECYRACLISPQEVSAALRLKILADFDTYLFSYSGRAQFIPSFQLDNQVPIAGFDLQELLFEAKQRQAWWHKLQAQIPSMHCVPLLDRRAVQASNLTLQQKQRLETLAADGKTLEDIASLLAQDSLEVAKFFAKLTSQGLVTLTSSSAASGLTVIPCQEFASEKVKALTWKTPEPAILVVDDSPLLLKQFENLVTRWGYRVKTSADPETLIETMLCVDPAIVFLDVNMPGVSGFDLVIQIRRCPEFAAIPLVILTAEKTLTNNWRARWSGCRFLTKPLMASEVTQFQTELRLLLEEIVPLQPTQPSSELTGQPLTHPVHQG